MENEKQIPEYTTEDIQAVPELIEAVVINMELKTAKDIFGDKAENPETQMLVITCENQLYSIKVQENCTYFDKGLVPDRSKLGQIIDFYKELKVGTRVKLLKNNKGFFDIRK